MAQNKGAVAKELKRALDRKAETIKRLMMTTTDEKRGKEISVTVHTSPRGFQLLGIRRSCRTSCRTLLLPVMLLRALASRMAPKGAVKSSSRQI